MALSSILGDLALESSLTEILMVLNALNSKQGFLDPTTGGTRVAVTSLPTLSTVSTVSTVSNMAAVGGYNAAYDQYSAMLQTTIPIRSQIVVTT